MQEPVKNRVFLRKETLLIISLNDMKRELLLTNTRHMLADSVMGRQLLFRSLLCHFIVSCAFDHALFCFRKAFEAMFSVKTRTQKNFGSCSRFVKSRGRNCGRCLSSGGDNVLVPAVRVSENLASSRMHRAGTRRHCMRHGHTHCI